MSEESPVTITITQAQLVIILAFVLSLKTSLPAQLINLTPGKRKSISKMGDKTLAFCLKALEYAILNPTLCPAYVSTADLQNNLDAVVAMQTILRSMVELTSKLDDSILLVGSEAYTMSLSIYHSIQDAARRNISGAKAAEVELKKRFPGRKPNDTPPPPSV